MIALEENVFHCISVQSQWVLVADLFDLDDMYEKDKYEYPASYMDNSIVSRVWNVTTVMPGFQRYVSVHPYLRVPFQKYARITFICKNSIAHVKTQQ